MNFFNQYVGRLFQSNVNLNKIACIFSMFSNATWQLKFWENIIHDWKWIPVLLFKSVIFNLEEFPCKFNRFIRLNYFSCDSFKNIKFSKSAESLIYGTPAPPKKYLYWHVYFGPRVPKNIYYMPYLITF